MKRKAIVTWPEPKKKLSIQTPLDDLCKRLIKEILVAYQIKLDELNNESLKYGYRFSVSDTLTSRQLKDLRDYFINIRLTKFKKSANKNFTKPVKEVSSIKRQLKVLNGITEQRKSQRSSSKSKVKHGPIVTTSSVKTLYTGMKD